MGRVAKATLEMGYCNLPEPARDQTAGQVVGHGGKQTLLTPLLFYGDKEYAVSTQS